MDSFNFTQFIDVIPDLEDQSNYLLNEISTAFKLYASASVMEVPVNEMVSLLTDLNPIALDVYEHIADHELKMNALKGLDNMVLSLVGSTPMAVFIDAIGRLMLSHLLVTGDLKLSNDYLDTMTVNVEFYHVTLNEDGTINYIENDND